MIKVKLSHGAVPMKMYDAYQHLLNLQKEMKEWCRTTFGPGTDTKNTKKVNWRSGLEYEFNFYDDGQYGYREFGSSSSLVFYFRTEQQATLFRLRWM